MMVVMGFKCLDCKTQIGQLSVTKAGEEKDVEEDVKCPQCGSKNVEYKMKI